MREFLNYIRKNMNDISVKNPLRDQLDTKYTFLRSQNFSAYLIYFFVPRIKKV